MSGKYTMGNGTEMTHLVHISDWMPTFLSWAGAKETYAELSLDGKDQSEALLNNKEVRNDILLELFTEKESHDNSYSASYRKGKYKLIQGNIKDSHWYYEPTKDMLNSTDSTWLSYFVEIFMKWLEALYDTGPIDLIGDLVVTHIVYYQNMFYNPPETLLFDLEADPQETTNIARENADIVNEFSAYLEEMKKKRPHHPKYWLVSQEWADGAGKIPGDCSQNSKVKTEHCKFAHPWIPDTTNVVDEEKLNLIPGVRWWVTHVIRDTWHILLTPIVVTFLAMVCVCAMMCKK